MPLSSRQDYVIIDLIQQAVRNIKAQPLNLGGFGGPGGGTGTPPGGFIGRLPQYEVAYDETEAATLDTLPSGLTGASGWSLVDNLNHIRYRIQTLESGGSIIVEDWDGNPSVNPTNRIIFSGAIVTDLGDGDVLVAVGSGGGGGSPLTVEELDGSPSVSSVDKIKFNGAIVTDLGGGDVQVDAAPQYAWFRFNPSDETLEFGADVGGKEVNSGKIGYESFGAGDLHIVGAGTSPNRSVRLHDKVISNLFQGGIRIPFMTSAVVLGTDGSDNIVDNTGGADARYAAIANGVTNGDSHNHVGGDGGAIFYTEAIGAFLDGNTVPASSTYHGTPFRVGVGSGAGNFPWPDAGTLSNMSLRTASAQPGTGSLVATLYINNSASSIVITIAAGSSNGTFSDTTHTEAISAGDVIRWQFQNNASSASAQLTAISMRLTKQTI